MSRFCVILCRALVEERERERRFSSQRESGSRERERGEAVGGKKRGRSINLIKVFS